MEPRLIIAYSLMLILTLLVACFVAYRIYHSRERSYRRRLRQEKRAYDASQSPAAMSSHRPCWRAAISGLPGHSRHVWPAQRRR